MSLTNQSSPYAVLKIRDFRHYLLGRMSLTFGINMVSTAVSWQIFEYTNDALSLGMIGLAEFLPFLVVTSSDDSITKPGFDYVFRLNQPASTYAEVLFDIFKDNGVKSVAILAGNAAFEKSVQTAAVELAKKNGVTVVENQNYDKGLTDFRPILNGFKAKSPDAVSLLSVEKVSPALIASSICTLSRMRFVGSMVVSHNCSGFISPRPL